MLTAGSIDRLRSFEVEIVGILELTVLLMSVCSIDVR
jgi:hypothetical protein